MSGVSWRSVKRVAVLTSERDVVKMLGRLDGLDVSADVKLLGLVVEVEGGWVGDVVGSKDLLGFDGLVRLVDVGDWCECGGWMWGGICLLVRMARAASSRGSRRAILAPGARESVSMSS